MRDELEEGHFDTMGNFIYKKGEESIKDAWLDNIDWAKIKKDAGEHWQQEQVDPFHLSYIIKILTSSSQFAIIYEYNLFIVHLSRYSQLITWSLRY